MKVTKLTATALLAVAATAITFGTATAEPATASWPTTALPVSFDGTQDGIGFHMDRDGSMLVATLTGGRFQVGEHAVNVVDPAGAVVASLPMQLPVGDHEIALAPRLDAAGAKLVAEAQPSDA